VSGVWLTRWRDRLLRPLLGLLAANALAALVYTLPRTLQQRSLSEHQAALKNDVERERRQLQRLKERAEAIEGNTRDLHSFYNEVLKERSQLMGVLKEIDRQAPSRGSLNFRPIEVKGAPVSRFVATMPLAGSYEQLVTFLKNIERSPHFVTVDRITLREREAAAQLDVELSVYLREAGEKS
jgi:type IV pilus assembly protein PilO